MNTFEIEKTILRDKCLGRCFLGVFPSDKLPVVIEKPACFIANTDPLTRPVQHWVSLLFDKYIEYFDTNGLEPLEAFKRYEFQYINKYCLQDFDSTVCREYCIYFLHKRSRGLAFEIIIDSSAKRSNGDQFANAFVDRIRVSLIRSDCQSVTYIK